MNYHITRGDRSYGPYTLADLQRYVASGHILPADLALGDEMTTSVPVAEILNPSGQPRTSVPPPFQGAGDPTAMGYQIGYGQPPSEAPMAQFDDPPNLHWALVLLFDALTFGLFQMVWNIIFSVWMRRVQPNGKAIFFYIAGYVLGFVYTIGYLPGFLEQMRHVMAHDLAFQPDTTHRSFLYLIAFAGWAAKLVARFAMKGSLEEHYNTVEPIGLRLNWFLVLVFGGIYIQSQLNRVNRIKQAIRYGTGTYL